MKGKILAYGEIMMRLSAPDGKTVRESSCFSANYGGTEANVLACLHAFGRETKYLTALPEGPLGEAVLDHLHRFRIDTSDIVVQGDTLGLYFSENGNESRGTNVIYYRRHSEFTRLSEASFDYDKVFCGVSIFHISGISLALSDSSRALAFRLIREAKARGIAVSFDFNYRASLWSVEDARPCLAEAAAEADILLAGSRDLASFLHMTADEVMARFPCQYLVVRDRKVIAPDRHAVQVSVFGRKEGEERVSSPEIDFPVLERIGGGDAFDGALLHALTEGEPLGEAVMFAVAAFALKHTVKGDTFTLCREDVLRYRHRLEGTI